uniref:NADH dehydrogenase subunit 2 n=1 Tax=Cycetogamasus diviortus TaxID=2978624 RepID=UPI0022F32E8A|nr:NADH dehydrogenase subunit 2 [Cycetogamasus diviortus]WAK85121.1 NADH dehydrogenase subunit 2 [Cycetogamasus diviortus]
MLSSMNNIFLLFLALSTFLAISTNNWFQMWLALEVNMMMFLPLMFNKDNLSINSMMKYFIVQAFASSIFIFSMIFVQKFFWDTILSMSVTLAMLTKLGMFPLYFWFPQVSEGLAWMSFTLLSTVQKIIPLYIVSMSSQMLFMGALIMSSTIGCLSMINQSSLRKLLAYSSLTHMSWMLLSMLNNNMIWVLYFVIYSSMMLSIFFIFNPMNMSSISNLKTLNTFSLASSLFISMMSLGGLPPFLGFLPKWAIISNSSNSFFLLFILIISSLVSIFVYLRLTYPMMFNKFLPLKFSIGTNTLTPILVNTIFLIPLSPLIFF